MKKYLSLQILLILFVLVLCEVQSYGADKFKEHYDKGIEFYKQGKYDQAGKEFEQAIAIKPNDVYALYGLGNTHYCKAMYDDAIKVYSKAIKINPDYAKVHYSLSLAYSKQGMTREAEKEKAVFRKLSQGGKSGSHKTSSPASTKKKVDHTPKKTLSHAPAKSSTHAKSDTHAKKEDSHARHDTHAKKDMHAKHDTHAKKDMHAKHDTHAKKEDSHARRDTHAASRHEKTSHDTSGGDSHSIFKGYGEGHEADERVFTKKHHGSSHTGLGSPLGTVKYYVMDRWNRSGISKLWIGTVGYIVMTQMWLCVVAFFCLIVWRIREKVD